MFQPQRRRASPTPSCCRRRTSPARCTWATRSSTRCMDALIRYHRMRGYDTLWQMGTDHAGIATEMVVARNLAREGKGETRDALGRDGFIEKVWEWKQQSGDTIERQMRRLGTSGDWSRSAFTMDPMAVRGGGRGLRAPARARPDLPRPAPGQLGSGAEDRDLRPGSGQRGRRRLPVVDLLSADRRQRLARGRDHAPGNHARRHRGDGASGRRALRAPDRQDRDAAADRPRDPGHRRRLRRPRVRHRRGQGHAGARLQRLRRSASATSCR